MVRRLFMTMSVAGALLASGAARAQSGGSGSSTPVEHGFWEKVQSVDANAGTITLERDEQLNVSRTTRITRDGTEASIADVIPGDQVQAAYLTGKGEGPVYQVKVRSEAEQAREAPAPTPK